MDKVFRVVSITYEHAKLEIRERFSMPVQEVQELYIKIKEVLDIHESIILITCNRAEIYYFHEEDLNQDLIKLWCSHKALRTKDYHSYFYSLAGLEAIVHIHRVSIGLESQVLGDIQVFSQVKQAYQSSVDAGHASTLMNRLMHKVFFCHKAINQETKFKSGSASVSYNAVDVLQRDHFVTHDAKILLIGAGQIGSDISRHLHKKGYTHLSVTNRTISKAMKLADECNMTVVPFCDHLSMFDQFDVIISSLSCQEPVYKLTRFESTQVRVVIDVSAPRSIASEVETLGISLYNVDQLRELVNHVLKKREEEIPKVEELISESANDFVSWTENLAFSDSVKKFKTTLEELRLQTIASMIKKMSDDQKELAEEITRRMVQKIINLPVVSLKTACLRNQEPSSLSETLNELFNPEYKNQVKS